MGEEVLGLNLTRARVRMGKMVTSTDETSRRSTRVVGGERGVQVSVSLGGLYGC